MRVYLAELLPPLWLILINRIDGSNGMAGRSQQTQHVSRQDAAAGWPERRVADDDDVPDLLRPLSPRSPVTEPASRIDPRGHSLIEAALSEFGRLCRQHY